MPIVGSFAGASARAYGLGAGVAIGDFESIQTITVGTATSTVEFTSIPATYTHLQLRVSMLSSVQFGGVKMQFNSDTGTNYSWHNLYGNGTGAFSDYGATQAQMYIYFSGGTTNPSAGVYDVLDYANTNKYKTMRGIEGVDANGSGYVNLTSGNWRSTSAITSIKLTYTSQTFNTNSVFALYGVKA
jgi:hypothetical protein